MKFIKNGSISSILLILFVTSCGNDNDADLLQNTKNVVGSDTNLPDILASNPDVGGSYNKLSNIYLPSCFKYIETTSPTEVEESLVTYQDDLNEESFRNILDLELSAKIPIQEVITLNPKFTFSRDASVNTLSHNSTYIAYARLGQKKLVPYNQSKLVLKPQFRQYFDANGSLKNPYEFIRLCGDEIINAHELGSKLIITTKLSFQSKADKLFVEGDLGVSPTVAPSWSFNVKFRDMDIKLRQRLRINFYGIQIGGQPERLLGAMKSTSCTLDDLDKCQKLLTNLHDYLANDYAQQLVPTALSRWSIEKIETLPYYLSDIYDEDGKKLTFDIISKPEILDKLNKIKLVGQEHAITEQKNYQAADMMKQQKYLATDEKASLDEITTTALANIQRLQLFGNECYKDLHKCISSDVNETFSKIIVPYDVSLLGANIGVLLSKVYADTKPLYYFSNRVSEDFIVLQPELREGTYSSYYLKFKNLKNYVIKSDKVSVDISCVKYYFLADVLMKGAFQYYEVLHPQIALNYKNKCSDINPLFVSSPKGFAEVVAPDRQFIVELWGRT